MKIVMDDGIEVSIAGTPDPEDYQELLNSYEALIACHENWISSMERRTEAVRKHVFTLRREYDAILALKDASERHKELTEKFAKENCLLDRKASTEESNNGSK